MPTGATLQVMSAIMGHSGPSLAAKTRLLSFNRAQPRVIIGFLTGHNTLRRHIHIHLIWLTSSPLCMRCGTEDESSAHILCECKALASLIHIWAPFSWRIQRTEFKSGGHLELYQRNMAHVNWYQIMRHKGPVVKAQVYRDRKGSTPVANQSINQYGARRINYRFYILSRILQNVRQYCSF